MNDAIDKLIADLPSQQAMHKAKNEFAKQLEKAFLGDDKTSSSVTGISLVFIAVAAIVILGVAFLI